MGAWIEIFIAEEPVFDGSVAPLVGAWIEINYACAMISCMTVAPLVGAWIEIINPARSPTSFLSLLSWERGLKSIASSLLASAFSSLLSWERGLKSAKSAPLRLATAVAPLVGAWIEIQSPHSLQIQFQSLLSWERGLKLKNLNTNDCVIWSLLSWERGLKFCKVSGCACTCRRSSRGSVN